MKKFLKTSSAGFTLVELMVVVAIIGVLSAVAVPQFKKYQAKAKQSEAKIQLAAVYNAEVGSSSDYDTYATCLTFLSYETPAKGYYAIGFSAVAAVPDGQVANRANINTCTATASNFILPTNPLRANTAVALPVAGDLNSAVPTATVFRAAAAGNIATGGANALDKWTINETKTLTNVLIGY
jgi:type IV pilus assembly protein PilA